MKTSYDEPLLIQGPAYVPPKSFLEKHANHRLSTNVTNWQVEILKILGEEYSWVLDGIRPATVELEEVNKEEGTGYGAITVFSAPPPEPRTGRPEANTQGPQGPAILIPFTVKAFQMSPLDVFISGKKVIPLSAKRVREQMASSQIFSGVDRSKNKNNDVLSQLSIPSGAAYGQFGRQMTGEKQAGKFVSFKKEAGFGGKKDDDSDPNSEKNLTTFNSLMEEYAKRKKKKLVDLDPIEDFRAQAYAANHPSLSHMNVKGYPHLEALRKAYQDAAGQSKQAGDISTQDSYILQQLLPTLHESDLYNFRSRTIGDSGAVGHFMRNGNLVLLQMLTKAKGLSASDYKNTLRHGLPKNVVVFEKISAGRWKVSMYNDNLADPDVVTMAEHALLQQFSEFAEINKKLWETDGFVVTFNHKEKDPIVFSDSMTPQTTDIHSPGVWNVVTRNGQVQTGFAWKGFHDYQMNLQPYTLWYDGAHWCVQERMRGDKADTAWTHEEGTLQEGAWGTFLVEHESGERFPVMPFRIRAIYKDQRHFPSVTMIRGTDLFGHDVSFLMPEGDHHHIGKWCSAAGINSPDLAEQLGAHAYWVPKGTQYVTLGSQRISIMELPQEVIHAFRDTAMSSISSFRDRRNPATTLVVRCREAGDPTSLGVNYTLEGAMLEPLLKANAADLNRVRAKWALVMMGCSIEKADAILDRAHRDRSVIVMNLRPLRSETIVKMDATSGEVQKISQVMRRDLFKEAAYIRDRKSVDAMLSLNFVTPENLMIFLENIPKFRDVEGELAKLLLMSRMGLEAVPEAAVANALKNLNQVNEALEMLHGVLGNDVNAVGDTQLDEEEPVSAGSDSTLE